MQPFRRLVPGAQGGQQGERNGQRRGSQEAYGRPGRPLQPDTEPSNAEAAKRQMNAVTAPANLNFNVRRPATMIAEGAPVRRRDVVP